MNAPQLTASVRRAAGANDVWRVYAYLQERARTAAGIPELRFSLANEPWQLLSYRQAFIWELSGPRTVLRTVSGLARLGDESPLTVWLKMLGRILRLRILKDPERNPFFLDVSDMPPKLTAGWNEWLPEYLLVHPILSPPGDVLGIVAFAVEEPVDDSTQEMLLRTVAAYGHAWSRLAPAGSRSLGVGRIVGWSCLLLALAAMFLPVRLSVLAPTEIIGLDAVAISAPMDGVVKGFDVRPNQEVREGQRLFTLDDTTLRNRREVTLRQLEVARANALAAAQRAFANDASRADLASLNGKVAEREAELDSVQDMLARIEIRSPGTGVMVFGDVNDWQGKPVVTGERVALLADRANAGLLLWMPVADAINLEAGASVRVFLDVAPLEPLSATLFETSYQAVAAPTGEFAYRLRARFADLTEQQREIIRIGLKGTAKVYGESASLAYYLFRRPLAALREMTGL